jgi:hypothetical protein
MKNPSWHKIEHTKENKHYCCSCGDKIIYYLETFGMETHALCKKCYDKYYKKV